VTERVAVGQRPVIRARFANEKAETVLAVQLVWISIIRILISQIVKYLLQIIVLLLRTASSNLLGAGNRVSGDLRGIPRAMLHLHIVAAIRQRPIIQRQGRGRRGRR